MGPQIDKILAEAERYDIELQSFDLDLEDFNVEAILTTDNGRMFATIELDYYDEIVKDRTFEVDEDWILTQAILQPYQISDWMDNVDHGNNRYLKN